jgi:hypothetical protein
MTGRRVLSLLCVAACSAALAGCGGDTLSFDPVASAASKTAEATSSRVEFTAMMDVAGAGGMSFSGSGVFDGHSHSGALNMRFSMPPQAQSALGGADPTMEMIMDGRSGLVMYMRSPLFATISSGKWLKVDMKKLADKEGVDLSSLMSANQADPSQTLGMLKASSDARPLGYDRVRGVLTTHYELKIDLERLARDDEALRKTLDRIRELSGVTSYPAEAWIDDQERVRRLKIDMSFNSPAGGAMHLSMTEDLYAFGVKVDVQPPAASDVLDLGALGG